MMASIKNTIRSPVLLLTLLVAGGMAPSALALPAGSAAPSTGSANGTADALAIQACDCIHNNDTGRWKDASDPAGRLDDLCKHGGGCYRAEIGRMCVTGDLGQCGCAVQSARDWQSWHGDWFLWTVVNCGGLSVTITT